MKNKKESLILGDILKKIAPRIGATVSMEPVWNMVGRITFGNGRHSYFRYNTLDLNPMGSSEIARDKDYSNFFMNALGYPTVPGSKVFFSKEWGEAIGASRVNIHAAYKHARKLGFPVIVKPNSGYQGICVSLVHDKRQFYQAVHSIFKRDRIVLVQKRVIGKDYRLVVLDEKIISAYERIPLCVIGDGKSTVRKLLYLKQIKFIESNRDTQIHSDDPRIANKLSHEGMSFRTIPKTGQRVFLLDNANLSTGGDSIDVSDIVHPAFKKIAISLTREMGLRLCGVDLIVEGDISRKPDKFWVLEINSAPGLDHYSKLGKAQENIVENLYLEVLRHLGWRKS